MIDLFYEKGSNWQSIFAKSTTEQNIDNLIYTLTKDKECSDAYKADLKSWLVLLIQVSQ